MRTKGLRNPALRISHWVGCCLLSIFLCACPPKNNNRPQRHVETVTLPQLPASVIQVPIELPVSQLKRLVDRSLSRPLWQAKTKKFTLRLASSKAVEDQNWIERTANPLLTWVDKTVDASAQFAYTVDLQEWTLQINGQQVEAIFVLNLDGRVELDNALQWKGERLGLRQALRCPTQVRLALRGDLTLTADAALQWQLDTEQGGRMTITRLCSNQQLKTLNLPELLRPTLEPLQKELTRLINNALTQQLQRVLDHDHTREKLHFQHYIDYAAQYLAQAYPLQDSIWLLPNAEKIVVSPPQGTGYGPQNRLLLAVGIVARPSLLLQRAKPLVPMPERSEWVLMPYRPQATLYVQGRWSLEHAAEQVQYYLSNYVQEEYASYGYDVGELEIYPQGKRAVVAIQLLRRATGKHKAWIYIKGEPQYDTQTQEVFLSDLQFAAESKDILLNVAKWWKQAELLRRLEANTRWDAAPYFEEAQQQLRYWRVEQEGSILEGRFTNLTVEEVWISEHYFEVSVRARGMVRAQINWDQW